MTKGCHARWASVLLGAALLCVGNVRAFGATSDPVSEPTPASIVSADYFPIGVFSQPISSFSKWQSRGVNTLVAYESEGMYSVDQWSAAANAAGMYQIRQAGSRLAVDNANPYLLAFLQPDEPEINGNTPAALQANYAALKAGAPSKPVFQNFSGGWVMGWQGNLSKTGYQPYMAAADWIGADIYPVTGWNNPAAINVVGQALQRLADYSLGKPGFAFIETSNQQLNWVPNARGVTASEYRGEVWDAIINGAKGIVYFPQQFNGFNFDGTPNNVVDEMTKQDGVINKLARVINSAQNPSGTSMNATSTALESTWRMINGINYYILLNDSNLSVSDTITLTGTNGALLHILDESDAAISLANGQFNVTLDPFEYHIYTLDPTGQNLDMAPEVANALLPTAVPEPGVIALCPLMLLAVRRPRRASL